MREGFEHLSRRQRQVVDAVVSGKSNKIIAYDLGLSTRTVELHRANAMAKLGVANVAELVRLVDSLSAHEDILRASAESFPGMVAFWNRALVCTFANDAYLEWFGKPAHAVLGTDYRIFWEMRCSRPTNPTSSQPWPASSSGSAAN